MKTTLLTFACKHNSKPCSSWLHKLSEDNGVCVCVRAAAKKRGTEPEQKQQFYGYDIYDIYEAFYTLTMGQVIGYC